MLGVHIKYLQRRKEVGHILLETFFSYLSKLVSYRKKTKAKTVPLGFLYPEAPPKQKHLGNLDL